LFRRSEEADVDIARCLIASVQDGGETADQDEINVALDQQLEE
jgi:hypothetical protein